MSIHADKPQDRQTLSPSISGAPRRGSALPASGVVDNRATAARQKQLQALADHSPLIAQLKAMRELPKDVAQRKAVTQFVLNAEDLALWADLPQKAWVLHLSLADEQQIRAHLGLPAAAPRAAGAAAAPAAPAAAAAAGGGAGAGAAAAGGGAGATPAAAGVDEKKSAVPAKQAAEWAAALKTIRKAKMIDWEYKGKRYHINFTTATYHVTYEVGGKVGKIHYFFQGSGDTISDKPPTAKERGMKGGKLLFSDLDRDVQAFIKANWKKIT